jgi:calcineurin-like phosphoesterase family protein
MPAKIWFISDTHFGHAKTCTEFKRVDGTPLRPFASAEEMDEVMVERWNALVQEQDKVYHCGDAVITSRNLPILGRLNGQKRLVRGNHDIFKAKEYLQYFKEINGVKVLEKYDLVLTHIPMHTDEVARFGHNVHGHLHDRVVMRLGADGIHKEPDPRYISVCVEQTNYAPISLDEVMARKDPMAEPIPFCGFNKKLLPAPGTEETVGTLCVFGNGRETISCWKLTPEEQAHVAKTGEIWASQAAGQSAPPLFVTGFPLMEALDPDTNEPTTYHTDGHHVVEDARRFAILQHGDQKYGDDLPYSYHLGETVQVLCDFGAEWVYLVAGYGHDLEEDCWPELPVEARRRIVTDRFGGLPEAMIWACTGLHEIDGVKQNRAARYRQIFEKINAFPAAAPVKGADAIANMEACVQFQSKKGSMYLDDVLVLDDAIGHILPPEMRRRYLRAAFGIQAYAGASKITTPEALAARLEEVQAIITPDQSI